MGGVYDFLLLIYIWHYAFFISLSRSAVLLRPCRSLYCTCTEIKITSVNGEDMHLQLEKLEIIHIFFGLQS